MSDCFQRSRDDAAVLIITLLAAFCHCLATMVFFFGRSTGHSKVVESSIGNCQFCHANKSVDLIQTHRQFWCWFCIPTPATSNTMVKCRACRKTIKAEYYYSITANDDDDVLKNGMNGKEQRDDDEMVVMGTAV